MDTTLHYRDQYNWDGSKSTKIVLLDEESFALPDVRCSNGAAEAPRVVDALVKELSGQYRRCDALAAEMSVEGWQCTAWISDERPEIVLAIIGQG